MASELKCPLKFDSRSNPQRVGTCTTEKCAWWDGPRNRCAVASIAHEAAFVGAEMSSLQETIRQAVVNLRG